MINTQEATAVLGGGCFWCIEALLRDLRGVIAVKSGYAGGTTQNPTYAQVCTGSTGHAEVVRVTYDPDELSYADLLGVFFTVHDPTTRDRQGNDVGSQYRSAIMVANDAEAVVAHQVMEQLTAAGVFPHPMVTQVTKLDIFWPAEDEHDDYFVRNPSSAYCQAVVAPKVVKFRNLFADRMKMEAA